MATITADKFLDLLRASGLVEAEPLTQSLAALAEAQGADAAREATAVAEHLVAAGLVTRWQADRLLEGRNKGFFLGSYRLHRLLGSGGMSSVFLAEHKHMRRMVAIKVLPKHRIDDSSYLERFYLEAQAAARLDHPNIVRAYDVACEGTTHFLVMEYVEGRDLQITVKEDGPLAYSLAADYIRQSAEGLHHAHEARLIHRDIKPANLLVDNRGVVKVLDMGLAKFSDETKTSLTVAHDENVLGTADYLAPEQAVNSHNVDARVDLYSLGCTLYYCLTGHPPFNEGTLTQRLLKHQREEPPSILVDRPDAPKDLLAICSRMMAKAPDKRFQTAREVADVMAKYLSGAPVSVGAGSRGFRTIGANKALAPKRNSDSSGDLTSDIGGGSKIRRGGSGSGPLNRSTQDTAPNLQATVKVSGSSSTGSDPLLRKSAEKSGSDVMKGGGGKKLIKARALNDAAGGSGPMAITGAGSSGLSIQTEETPLAKRGRARRSKRNTTTILYGSAAALVILAIIIFAMAL
ncbi:MAG TPA: protein kinase [Pirellulales bacterium]|jgi:serine/threonine protein kinase|nr:protein kinase [Pirellulales bacterium]